MIIGSNLGTAVLDIVLHRRPKPNKLWGLYEMKASWGRAELEINKDGTFEESIQASGTPARHVSGTWRSTNRFNFVAVDFRPFGMVWDDDHDSQTSIYGIDFYKPHVGRTYGVIDDDLGENFEHQ